MAEDEKEDKKRKEGQHEGMRMEGKVKGRERKEGQERRSVGNEEGLKKLTAEEKEKEEEIEGKDLRKGNVRK